MNQTISRASLAFMAVAIATAFFFIAAAPSVDAVDPSLITADKTDVNVDAGSSVTVCYSINSEKYPAVAGYMLEVEYDPDKISVDEDGYVDLSGAEFIINSEKMPVLLVNYSERIDFESTVGGLFEITFNVKEGATGSTDVKVYCSDIVVTEDDELLLYDDGTGIGNVAPVTTKITVSGFESTPDVDSEIVLTIDSADLKQGGTADVAVRMSSESKIGGAYVTVKYDATKITMSSDDIVLKKMADAEVDVNNGQVRLTWIGAENADLNGVLFTMKLHAKSGTDTGTTHLDFVQGEGKTEFRYWLPDSTIDSLEWSGSGSSIDIVSNGGDPGSSGGGEGGQGTSVTGIGVFVVILVIMAGAAFILMRSRAN